MTKRKKIDRIKYWQKYEATVTLHTLLFVIQTCITTLEKCLIISYTVKHTLTVGPINSTPKYLPRKNEDLSAHEHLFIAAVSITAINWKTPKGPSTGEWTTHKLWSYL